MLMLSGNNSSSFTGDLNVIGGALVLGTSNALPAGITAIGTLGATVTSGGTVTLDSNIVYGDTTNLRAGQPISGTGIPAGAVISRITGGTSFVISALGTSSASGVTLTATRVSATLDLNGQTNVTGNVMLTGSGAASVFGGTTAATATNSTAALWNSSSSAASFIGTLNFSTGPGSNVTLGGIGDISLGTLGSGFGNNTVFKVGPNTLTISGNNTGFNPYLDILSGVVKVGSGGALGNMRATYIKSGGVLDINGQTVNEDLQLRVLVSAGPARR
jgi:hypothetical protein